jgi:hypothetical protein
MQSVRNDAYRGRRNGRASPVLILSFVNHGHPRPPVQLADPVPVSNDGERMPASSSRYSWTLTPTSHAARQMCIPRRRSRRSMLGNAATSGSLVGVWDATAPRFEDGSC